MDKMTSKIRRRQHGAVLAAFEPDQPRPLVFEVKFVERSFEKHPCS